jgi:hypothetical protein
MYGIWILLGFTPGSKHLDSAGDRVIDFIRAQLNAARTSSPESIRRRSAQALARLVPAMVRRLLRAL